MDDTAERIWLPRLPAFKENTFCVDQADTDTAEYVRADLHQKALDRIEALEAERLREELGIELKAFTAAGAGEFAAQNSNVTGYVLHWETRAKKAEAEVERLREALEQSQRKGGE